MANEVIELPVRQDAQNLPVTREAVDRLKAQRELLREFVRSQLRVEVDYGVIPGTQKPSLYKPGAEKLAQLFGFGIKIALSDRLLEREGNFAMFTYRAEVYPLRAPDLIIATCEGSCNSQEKKYATRTKYEWVDFPKQDGGTYRKKVDKGTENTPITDVLNTLIKMAQKRAMVGAVIQATGASDFFTQDIDSPEDADALGIKPKNEVARASVKIPTVTGAANQNQAATGAPVCCGKPMMISKFADPNFDQPPYYCMGCKKKEARQ